MKGLKAVSEWGHERQAERQNRQEERRETRKTREVRETKSELCPEDTFKGCTCRIADGGQAPGDSRSRLWPLWELTPNFLFLCASFFTLPDSPSFLFPHASYFTLPVFLCFQLHTSCFPMLPTSHFLFPHAS